MSISGKKLTCLVDGVELSDNYEWSADEGADMLDRTCGKHGGHEFEDAGVEHHHYTVKGYLDIATGEVGRVRQGTLLTDVQLYVDLDDPTPIYVLTDAIVARFSLGGQVKGKFEYTAEIHSRGDAVVYTDPG